MSQALTIRPATAQDAQQLLNWRNDPVTRSASLNQDEISPAEHENWFEASLRNPNRQMVFGLQDDREIGHVRLDKAGEKAVVSILLAPEARGQKLATPLLELAMKEAAWPVRYFEALVRPENLASNRLFQRLGFDIYLNADPMVYHKPNIASPLVVVLANEFEAGGQPNTQSLQRLESAAAQLKSQKDAKLVTSGWPYARDPKTPISTLMRRAAVSMFDIPDQRILESPRARDTVGDAVFLAVDVIGNAPPPKTVTVVTSAYHAARAQFIFDFVMKDIAPVTVIDSNEPVTADQKAAEAHSIAAFNHTFSGIESGDIAAIERRLWERHPLYNGEIYGPDSLGVKR